jgi:hypothetical protein
MEAWKIHFENLATPNLDENKFDLERNGVRPIIRQSDSPTVR